MQVLTQANAVAINHSAATTSTITEGMAIATVLQDMSGHAPTAAQVAIMSTVMTNAEVEIGFMAAANPSMTAGEVSNEIAQQTIYGATTAWGNAAAPVLTTAQATTQMAHFGETINLPTNLFAEAVNNLNIEVFGHSSSAAVDSSSTAMSNGMLNIGIASVVDPFMPAGEAGHQLIEDTLTGDATAWAASPMATLIGVQTTGATEFHLFS